MNIAVLGGNGLVGSDLVKYFSTHHQVTPITRQSYSRDKKKKFDLFINANGNSKRFWALQNIYSDFEASTVSVYKSIFDFRFNKYIYISSVDVYPDPSSPSSTKEISTINVSKQNSYGFHKYLSEQIIKRHLSDWVILRPSSILGTNLKKGPLLDALNKNPLFITSDSKLQYISTRALFEILEIIINKNITHQIFNTGGIGTYNISDLKNITGGKLQTVQDAQKQIYEMNVKKVTGIYKNLKTSEYYVKEFLKKYC